MGSRLLIAGLMLIVSGALSAQDAPSLLKPFTWRSAGPAVFSGRIVDLAVKPGDPSTVWAASGSGGLWKTVNRGSTWKPVFDDQPVISLGAVAVAPSDPDIVWVGTGEANNQRSSYWGNGVYKSTDGGETFAPMGLPESHHIGRIAIHPHDPDIVFVAALGHLYTDNPDRGLYRSQDGGRTWERVAHVDERTGFVDVAIDPITPSRVYAASYQRKRRAWHLHESGPGSGIWRSTDAGDTFQRLEGGLPSGEIGRIGLCMHQEDPRILYACVENRNPSSAAPVAEPEPEDDRSGDAPSAEVEGDEPEGDAEGPGAAPLAPRPIGGEVYRSDDGGDTWKRVNEKAVGGEPGYYYGQIRVSPKDPDRVWVLGVPLLASKDGGKTFARDGARGVHVDHHAMWIDPADPDHLLLGNDGGLCRSYDGGVTWDVYENLPLAQYYSVHLDGATPYRMYGGTQDNGSWGVPSVGATGGGIAEWEIYRVGGGDGFHCAVDPEDPAIVYCESQFGRPSRLDLRTFDRKSIRPPRQRGETAMRCNWMTPLVLSPHNPRTLYFASQRLYRSWDRGDTWEAISGDLSTQDESKIAGNVPHCTITTVAESPVRAGVIWAGTDDGKVWVTLDGGRQWRDLTDTFPKEVRHLWVSRVEPSHHDKGVCYVTFTGYREDHFAPHLFVTDDFGGTWQSLTAGLPQSPINVVREDPKQADLLFVGTEHGAWASLDAGDTWQPLSQGIPTIPVHDLAIHDRDGDLVAATHGRGLYVMDIAPLRELGTAQRSGDVHLCTVKVIAPPGRSLARASSQVRRYAGENPAFGAFVAFWLPPIGADDEVTLEIQDAGGRRVRTLDVESAPGLQRIRWNLTGPPAAGGRRGGGGGGGGGVRRGAPVAPGHYIAVLTVGDKQHRRVFAVPDVRPDPVLSEVEDEERGTPAWDL